MNQVQSKLCNKVGQIRSRGGCTPKIHKKRKVEGGLYIENASKTYTDTYKIHRNLYKYTKIRQKSSKTLRLERVPLEANSDLMAMAVL